MNQEIKIPKSTFISDMEKAINNPEYSDIIFLIEKQSIYCHKSILCQHEYFRGMFINNLKESQQKKIEMNVVPYDIFRLILDYIYTFQIKETNPDFIVELFQATDLFLIEGLKHYCENLLCSYITHENVCQLFQLANTYKSLFLKEECFDYIILYYEKLKETFSFLELPQNLKDEIFLYIQNKQKIIQKKSKKVS